MKKINEESYIYDFTHNGEDPYGVQVEIGHVVAFNFSGEVRLGRVANIKEARRNGNRILKITVEHMECDDIPNAPKKTRYSTYRRPMSYVMSPRNLVVLDRFPDREKL
jgi:hypothetical protein